MTDTASAAARRILVRAAGIGFAGAAAATAPALANTLNGSPVTGQVIVVDELNTPTTIVVDSSDIYGPRSVGNMMLNSSAIQVSNSGNTSITVGPGRIVGAYNAAQGIQFSKVTIGGDGRWSTTPRQPDPNPLTALTIVNAGDIYGQSGGILAEAVAQSFVAPDMINSISISGTGRVFAGNTAITANARTVMVDGLGYIAGQNGIRATADRILLGGTTRLGTIVASTGFGISTFGREAFVYASDITAGSSAIVMESSTFLSFNSVSFTGSLTALRDGVTLRSQYRTALVSGEGTGSILANWYGIVSTAPDFSAAANQTNALIVRNIPLIQAGLAGITLTSGSGVLEVDGVGQINSGAYGIWVTTSNNVLVGTTARLGNINAGAHAFWLVQPSLLSNATANVNLRFGSVSAGNGIYGVDLAANTTVNFTGTMNASGAGVYLFNHLGPVVVEGNGVGTMTGGAAVNVSGRAAGNSGTVTVRNLASISSSGDTAVLSRSNASTIVSGVGSLSAAGTGIRIDGTGATTARIDGIGSLTAGGAGIDVAVVGDVFIGTQVPLGTVFSQNETAIRSVGNATTGTFSMISTGNIGTGSATRWAVQQSGARAVSVVVGAGTIAGGVNTDPLTSDAGGMSLSSGQALGVWVGTGAILQGTVGLKATLLASAGSAVATISNSGTIRTAAPTAYDFGFALVTNGQVAVNNNGLVLGRLSHNAGPGFGVASLGFYNKFGATWDPLVGASLFGGGGDVIGNEGTILIRSGGDVVFSGLEGFYNNATGVLDFQGDPVTSDLTIAGLYAAQNGSRIKVNLAFGTAGAQDSPGSGDANTIVATSASPTGFSWVDIASTGSVTALTGSVALVFTGTNLPAPTAGTTLAASPNYLLGTHNLPTSARTFALVGDGAGGVFLQWVPVISGGTIGDFGGGALGEGGSRGGAGASAGGAGGGGLGFLQASLAGASQAARQVADMTGFGAAFGGAGAAGAGCGTSAGAAFSVRTGAWAGSGSRSGSRATAQGQDLAFSPGAGADSCGRVSVGAFQFGGTSAAGDGAARSGTTARGDVRGAGGYVRADSGVGFYAQLTGAAGMQRAQVRNGVFGTVATVDASLGMLDATVGYARPVADGVALEARLSATRLTSVSEPFRDSLGFEVTRLGTQADSLSATAGLVVQTDSGGQGIVRAGLRTTDARQEGLAYGVRTLSEEAGTGTLVEASWRQPISADASLDFALASDTGGPVEQQEVRVGYTVSW